MRLYISLVNGQVIDAPGVGQPQEELRGIKRGVSIPLEIQFLDGDQADMPKRLPVGAVLNFGLKLPGQYEAEYLARVYDGAWTRPGADDGFYTATLNTNTDALVTAFLTPDGDSSNDKPTVTAMTVISYRLTGEDNPHVIDELSATIANSGDTGNEGEPVPADPSLNNRVTALETRLGSLHVLTGITDYTGGGGTHLDGQATVSVPVGHLYLFDHPADGTHFYQLVTSANPTQSPPNIIVPVDFDPSTNTKNFIRRL